MLSDAATWQRLPSAHLTVSLLTPSAGMKVRALNGALRQRIAILRDQFG